MEDRKWNIYEAWLNQTEGIGRQKMRRIRASGISFEEIYESDKESLHNILKRCRLETATRDSAVIAAQHEKITAEELYEKMSRHNIFYVNQWNADYPKRLAEIPDAPYALFRRGLPFEPERRRPILAVVGARMCSQYGRHIAGQIGMAAAEMGFEVVSGLARGIDGIAQHAAWQAGGEVTAVLGSGVDVCYPKENRAVYDEILARGRIISEYSLGTQPSAGNFPPRNRIISGLADALIVVEAKKHSGTLITVDMALEQGRDVYVVPGRLTDPMSYGCNRLVAQGASGIVDLSETLLEIKDLCTKEEKYNQELTNNRSLHNTKQKEKRRREAKEGRKSRDDLESLLLEAVDVEPKSVQEIYETINRQTELSIRDLQQKLIEMELREQIAEEGGRYCCKF